jgi:hypothetical protein
MGFYSFLNFPYSAGCITMVPFDEDEDWEDEDFDEEESEEEGDEDF